MLPVELSRRLSTKSNLIFYDDFCSGQLDRSKWNVMTTGTVFNNEQQAYIDSSETIYVTADEEEADNYVLALHPRYRPGFKTADGQQFDFISGRIDTRQKFDFQYGTASARIKLPAGIGLWPAFWAMGNGKWPDVGEIDIMEFVGESDWVSSAVHGPGYSGEAGLVNKHFFPNGKDANAWHIYTVEWTAQKLVFKVDETLIYRITRPMTDFFGGWAFDNSKFLILNFALGGIYPFKTNGIQSPYYGLPQETVDNIKSDRIRVLVDWVSVIQ